MTHFLVLNMSNKVSDAEAQAMVDAVNTQVARDYSPAWGITPVRVVFGRDKDVEKDSLLVYILDTPDTDGALGYHTESGNKVYAKVFTKPVLRNGGCVLNNPNDPQACSVASVLSHEVLEVLGDPFCNAWSEGPPIAEGHMYSFENCDPVEGDSYTIDGVQVSNFILPAWFNSEESVGPFDFLKKLKKPFTMTPGGYMVVSNGARSKQVYGHNREAWKIKAKKKNKASRTFRRTKKHLKKVPA